MDLVAWERVPLWMLGLHAYLMQTEKDVDFLLLNCLTIKGKERKNNYERSSREHNVNAGCCCHSIEPFFFHSSIGVFFSLIRKMKIQQQYINSLSSQQSL